MMIKKQLTNSLLALLLMLVHTGNIYSQCEPHACDPVLTGMNWDLACVPVNNTAIVTIGWALSGGDLTCTTPPGSWRIQISFAQGGEYEVNDASAASGPSFTYDYDAPNKTINATLNEQIDWAASGEIAIEVRGITPNSCDPLTSGANIQIVPSFLGGCPEAFQNQIANDVLSAALGVDFAVPVELIDFSGAYNLEKDQNELTWSTASEINSDYFSLERMNARGEFEEIARVTSTGNPANGASYAYDDRDIAQSKTYFYRLVQHDFDGQSETLPVVAIDVNRERGSSFEIYPNPVTDKFIMTYSEDNPYDMQVEIYNAVGELVTTSVLKGNVIEIDMESLHSGVYFVQVSNFVRQKVFEQKIVKL